MRTAFSPTRVTLLTVVAVALTACGGGSGDDGAQPACPTSPSAVGAAVAVGAHLNAPGPVLPSQGLDHWFAAAEKDGTAAGSHGVTLVRVDGRPSVGCIAWYDSTAKNTPAQKNNKTSLRSTVQGLVGTVQAQAAESNPLLALSMAGDAAGPGGTVILLDSGLQTMAPLDFAHTTGLFTTAPDAIADQLRAKGDLPHLAGQHVVLVGIGQTYAPQAALSIGQRDHLTDVWRTIAERAGAASVETVDTPNTTAPAAGLPTVAPVTVPPDTVVNAGCNQESVFADDGPVGFVPGRTAFLRPGEARRELGRIGQWLADNPRARATVKGSIAHYGTDDGDDPRGLSARRAAKVAAVLRSSGAEPRQLTAEGQGWGPFPSRTAAPDHGRQDQRNRRVVVDTLC